MASGRETCWSVASCKTATRRSARGLWPTPVFPGGGSGCGDDRTTPRGAMASQQEVEAAQLRLCEHGLTQHVLEQSAVGVDPNEAAKAQPIASSMNDLIANLAIPV